MMGEKIHLVLNNFFFPSIILRISFFSIIKHSSNKKKSEKVWEIEKKEINKNLMSSSEISKKFTR